MKFSALAAASLLLPAASPARLVQRNVRPCSLYQCELVADLQPAPDRKVLGLDIQRRAVDPVAHDRLRRRSKTVQETVDNLDTLYFANASLGTPPQSLRFHLDTGSSDLWANSKKSDICSAAGNLCSNSGAYDANASSTYSYVNSLFNISYIDGSSALGDYATDTFAFGGQTIKDLQFGIGYRSSSQESIMGIGYAVNEVQVARAGGKPYANLPALLAKDGVTNTNAYSLWLNDLDASTGSILFGGVDTAKYSGQLSKLPIIQEEGVFVEFIIALTGLGQNGEPGSIFNNQTVAVLLDSGSSLTYLPDNIVSSLYTEFKASYDSGQGAAFVDCNLANKKASLDFTFTSPTISVALNELVVVSGYQRGKPICILGIAPAGDSTSVLGDTFLRSAYVVYDLDNNQIAMAPTNFNSTDSNVSEIASGTDGMPDATVVPNAVSTADLGAGAARNGGPSVTGSFGSSSKGAAMPAKTPSPWLHAGAAAAGAGLLIGF